MSSSGKEQERLPNWSKVRALCFYDMHILLPRLFDKSCRITHLKNFYPANNTLSHASKNSGHWIQGICSVPSTVFLFICCSPKMIILNCSIYFLSWKCQCIYAIKMAIGMYISGISIEMIKAVQCWSIIIFDLGFLLCFFQPSCTLIFITTHWVSGLD